MSVKDIIRLRLCNQHLVDHAVSRPEEVVRRMGAMQAQDYNMAKWAIGVRLPGATEAEIERAIDDGSILRTHIMRPTWHLVAAEDLRWMMNLTGPRIRNALNANNKRLGLEEGVFDKCNKIILRLLEGGRHMTRNQIMDELQQHKIVTDDLRASHIMYRADVDGLVCSGARIGKDCSYALYEERVPATTINARDEAVGELFDRYFSSHGPATLPDFVWWSGLMLSDARAGLEMNKSKMACIKMGEMEYWYMGDRDAVKVKKGSVHLVPAYDEYVVSYKDRSAVLQDEHFGRAIGSNGIFWPVIVADGVVRGTWKRTVKKDKTIVVPEYFDAGLVPAKAALDRALVHYAGYVGGVVEMG